MTETDRTYLPLRVKQGTNPTLVLLLSHETTLGVREKYPTAGVAWEFYLKDRESDPDPAPIVCSLAPEQDTPEETAVSVPIPAGTFDDVRRKVYHLDAVNQEVNTVAWGPISVLDV